MIISSFLSENYAFIFVLAILVFNTISSRETEKKVRMTFMAIACLAIIQRVVYKGIGYYQTLFEPSVGEMLVYSAGYGLRAVLLYMLLLIILRYESDKKSFFSQYRLYFL